MVLRLHLRIAAYRLAVPSIHARPVLLYARGNRMPHLSQSNLTERSNVMASVLPVQYDGEGHEGGGSRQLCPRRRNGTCRSTILHHVVQLSTDLEKKC